MMPLPLGSVAIAVVFADRALWFVTGDSDLMSGLEPRRGPATQHDRDDVVLGTPLRLGSTGCDPDALCSLPTSRAMGRSPSNRGASSGRLETDRFVGAWTPRTLPDTEYLVITEWTPAIQRPDGTSGHGRPCVNITGATRRVLADGTVIV